MVPPKNAFLSLRLPIFGASYYIFWGKEGRKEVLSSGSVLLCLHPLVLMPGELHGSQHLAFAQISSFEWFDVTPLYVSWDEYSSGQVLHALVDTRFECDGPPNGPDGRPA